MAPSLLAVLLAISAGALFYLSASHLLPLAQEAHKLSALLMLGAGIALSVFIVMVKHE